MAVQSFISALKSLATFPLVWINGLFACMSILLVYFLYTQAGLVVSAAAALLVALIFPFFVAGTYGVILDNNKKHGAFMIYARYGYTRCLFPSILLSVMTLLLMNVMTSVLMMVGILPELAVYIGMFIVIPVIFFCYFADITAVRFNLRMGQAIKDSARRVMSGSLSITAFYLMNIAMFFTASFVMSGIFGIFGADSMAVLAQLNETQILSMTPDELAAVIITPEIINAFVLSLAITALLFVPFFIAYKAHYFSRLIAAQTSDAKKTVEADGEYDEKGRWFKYK